MQPDSRAPGCFRARDLLAGGDAGTRVVAEGRGVQGYQPMPVLAPQDALVPKLAAALPLALAGPAGYRRTTRDNAAAVGWKLGGNEIRIDQGVLFFC